MGFCGLLARDRIEEDDVADLGNAQSRSGARRWWLHCWGIGATLGAAGRRVPYLDAGADCGAGAGLGSCVCGMGDGVGGSESRDEAELRVQCWARPVRFVFAVCLRMALRGSCC